MNTITPPPPQGWGPPPAAPGTAHGNTWFDRHRVATVVLAVLGSLTVIGAIGAAVSSADTVKTRTSASKAKSAAKPAPTPKPARSNADQMKDCVEAIPGVTQAHVSTTLVATVDAYTDIAGDMFSASDPGRLVVKGVQACGSTDSGTGYVSVYSASGDLIANGSF